MCGFAGLLTCDQRYRIDNATLSRMGAAVAHRGPDGREQWINHQAEITAQNPQCAMAFCRLAILDLDRRAMQPMTDGRRWLVFNGEIYNFRELRERLRQIHPDYPWKTTGDTEVLLRAYDAWGENCLGHLNGMFALAIWDPPERKLFLARDRMGQKPLFIALAPDHSALAFASEPGALRVLDWPDWSVDPDAVGAYLQNGYVPHDSTIYKGMRRVTPASFMVFAPGSAPRTGTYFDPNAAADFGELSRAAPTIEGIKSALLGAVRRQLVSDVPLGCFLSGGIDSSVIAAAMKAALGPGQRLLTFSIGFDDPRYDETAYAAAVAKHLGTEHRQFIVRPDAAADLPRLAAVFGEPFGDSSALPTHYLARQTREHVKVALSGDGGDELFGGYDRYRAMLWAQRMSGLPRALARAAAMISGTHPKSRGMRIKRFARSLHLPPAQRYAQFMALFDPQLLARIYPHPAPRNIVESTYARLLVGRDVVEAALATDRVTYLPDDLLVKLDRASMLHALEVRSPFMDHELVDLVSGLNTQQLLGGGPKRMLRQCFAAELPDFVFRRRKMGFAVPIGQWLRGELRPMLHDLLESSDSFASGHFNMPPIRQMMDDHQNKRVDYSQPLYALIMLELWWRGQAGAV